MSKTTRKVATKRAAQAALSKGEAAEVVEIIGAVMASHAWPFSSASDKAYVAMLGRIQGKLRRLAG